MNHKIIPPAARKFAAGGMKGSRFSETLIISILKETEAGLLVKDVCRKRRGIQP